MIKQGKLLLAEPFLLDPNFKRAAIALVDHHQEGSVGFVLNHPLGMGITDLLKDFPEFKDRVYYGGPVQGDTLHFIHTLGDTIRDAVRVTRELYWGGDFEQLMVLVDEGLADSSNVRFYLGYSGWSPGQLEEEMFENTWVKAKLTADLLFKTEAEKIWSQAMNRLGNAFTVIGNMDEEILN